MTIRTRHRNLLRSTLLASTLLATCYGNHAVYAQENSKSNKPNLEAVVKSAPDEPRATPVTRAAMKQYIEDLKYRTPRIPLPELSEDEKKRALEDQRNFGYEARLRNLFLQENAGGGYNGFGGSPQNTPQNANRFGGPPDPKLSLDYAFKVRLFWIAARGNNCQYCLGHQESKLLAAGMNEDEIAALDSKWDTFPEGEQAAFNLARRMTTEPHLLSDADIDACKKHFNDMQIIEMIGSIAGNNAINRWKEGTGSPQSTNGGNFGPATSTNSAIPPHDDTHSYLTPTSPSFAKAASKIVKLDKKVAGLAEGTQSAPTRCVRPELETGDKLVSALEATAKRTPRLPLTSMEVAKEVMGDLLPANAPVQQWMQLLSNFPVAGKRFATGLSASQTADALPAPLQAKINWVIARQDRAWYAAALAKDQMTSLGVSPAVQLALDGDLSLDGKNDALTKEEKAILIVAKNLAASPIVLTDRQVERAIEIVGPKAVVQTINYTTYRAAFDRITESAGLSYKSTSAN